AAEELDREDFLGLPERGLHRGIAGHQRDGLDAVLAQRQRQRGDHVGAPAGLDEGVDFRGDGENLDAGHRPNLSIMGWVIKQMPPSVRRNRAASSAVSSPTTSPAGMRTPRSMMTLLSRALRPTSTSGRMTAFSTCEKDRMWTLVNSSDCRTVAPETMQPPDTSEETACPRRPS